jgi:hypothetical protein
MKIKIHGKAILPFVLYGCETWSVILSSEHKLGVFENRLLRKIFGPRREEETARGDNYITRSFMICTTHQILFR